MSSLKLGLQLGYWGAQPPEDPVGIAKEAERLGFDSIYTAEAWGSDAFTPLAYIAAHTSKIKLGTAVVQLSARTPTATAMATLTLDHLSKGRVILGLGVSGPQVVEGWYGQPFSKPLARTREYIDIIRQVLKREAPVSNDGPHYPLPYTGRGRLGDGQAAAPDHASAARRRSDLHGRRGPEERGAGRRDRRRLAAALLLALPARGLCGLAEEREARLRDHPVRALQHLRRSRARR